MKKLLIISAAVMAMTVVHATAFGAELHLTASDNSSSYGNTSFNIWNKNGGGTEAPTSANDYVVDGGFTMRFPNGSYPSGGWVWPGKSLRIGTVGGSLGILVITRTANSTHTFNNGGLILAKGRIQPWVGNYTQTFTGTITVTAPESAPFDVMLNDTASHTNQTFAIGGTLKGAAGTALRVYSNTAYPAKFNLTTTPTAFAGTVIVGNGDATKQVTCSTDYNKEMPGGFLITTGSTLTALQNDKHWYIGFLELQSGASFLPPNSGTKWKIGDLTLDGESTLGFQISDANISTLTITNSLSVASGATLKFSGAPGESDTASRSWVVMTLPQDKGTIPLENFTLSGLPAYPSALPRYTLATNAVDGVWQLLLTKTAHGYLAVNDDTGGYSAAAEVSSACTNAASWASGAAPCPGIDYAAVKDKGGLSSWPVVRTPYQSEPWVFAGDSLTLGTGGLLLPCAKDVTFSQLVLSANSTYIMSLPGSGTHLRGAVQTVGGSDAYPQKIQAYMRGLNAMDAEISGNGTIWVIGRNSSGNPYGDVEFTALNTNFTGKVKLCAVGPTESSTKNPPSAADYEHERVFVTDARNLGGPLDAFRTDALELADYSVLEARNDVDMNVANRGITVTGNAGFAVPTTVTLSISNDITWNGTARKTGAGTLAIGGDPRIASGSTAALAVEKGYVKVLSTNALNCVSTTFANGAYLLVDPAATGDVATFGAVDLSATPFGGTLPVAFALPALGDNETYDYSNVAVCTVADATTAEGLTLSAKKIRGHSVKFTIRTNADGTTTVLAAVKASGFVITFQ